jgi:hypothetical protein
MMDQQLEVTKNHHCIGFLSLRTDGQKGIRRESRKPMNPLVENFEFRWSARYTLCTGVT